MKRMWRGMWYIEGYGSHPGWPFVIGFPVVCGLLGGVWWGLGTLAGCGALFLHGAYGRAAEAFGRAAQEGEKPR